MLFELDGDEGSIGRESLAKEVEVGNVEYKLKLIEPTAMRLQGLVTQLKWRLAEGSGEALYEIGVGDDGALAGLGERDMAASLDTLRRMCVALSAKQARRVIGVCGGAGARPWAAALPCPAHGGQTCRPLPPSPRTRTTLMPPHHTYAGWSC